MAISPIPMTYEGVRFRSTLEADWAATLDRYNIKWVYEPEGYRLDNINYLPDFYLPEIRIWGEVKGPLNERLDKTVEFQRALDAYHVLDFDDEWQLERQHVVICRPDHRGKCAWEGIGRHIEMTLCPRCERFGFINLDDPWRCRYGCESWTNKFWEGEGGGRFISGELEFFKAPRPYGRA